MDDNEGNRAEPETSSGVAGNGDAPARRSYDPQHPDLHSQGNSLAALAAIVLDLVNQELEVLACLIEEKSSMLTARIELLMSLSREKEGKSYRGGSDPQGEGYTPTAEGLGNLVHDMQYHDEACQRISCLRQLASDVRNHLNGNVSEPTQADVDMLLLMIERCHLGSLRQRLKQTLACHVEDERLEQGVQGEEEDEESVTLF